MNFLITILGLICFVRTDAMMNHDSSSPYEDAFLSSEVKNFTVTSDAAGK